MRNGGQPLPGSRESVIRETNREICAHLRSDWEWPQVSGSENRIDSDTQWRERDFNSSSPSPPSSPNPYKYDSPDSITIQVSTRKSKRWQELLAEAKWNEGLRIYITRRNDWTGGAFSAGLPSALGPLSTSTDLTQAIAHDISPRDAIPPTDSVSSFIEIVPVPRPLIASTNPIRAAITPHSYTQIYDKVVVEGTAPKIPINLADMTSAITAGWKAHGEWPPPSQPAQPAPIAWRKKKNEPILSGAGNESRHATGEVRQHRRSLTMRGVERVKKVLGLKDEEGDAGKEGEGH